MATQESWSQLPPPGDPAGEAPVGLSLGQARFAPQRPEAPSALMARADQRF